MDVVYIVVVQNGYVYNRLIIRRNRVLKYNKLSPSNYEHEETNVKPSRKKVRLFVDGILVYYFLKELNIASSYRNSFLDMVHINPSSNSNVIKLILIPANKELIDYSWNYRMTYLLRERCELEHTLSWLSTLGGAFSALGDYSINFAEVAGKISLNQLYLAFRLGDPTVISRCRLFFSLSLIQRQYFKLSKRIIYAEYVKAKNDTVIDTRLINMCKGIWCKMKYEYQIYKKARYLK